MTGQFIRFWGLGLLCLWLAPPLGAQVAARVARIEVRHVGPPAVSDAVVRANIRTKVGDAYLAPRADEDVRSLYATGFFYNIQVAEERTADGLALVFIVQGKPRLTDIKFAGNKKYSDAKLRKKLTSKKDEPLDEHKLFKDAQELKKIYEKAGYHRTEVKYVPNIDEAAGRGSVTFEITESPKVRIAQVEFVGAQAFPQKKLRKVIKTRKRWMFSWLTGSGRLKEDQFQEDKEKLAAFYREQGYMDFEIKDVQFEQSNPREMAIRLVVFEGKPYKVGAIAVTGETLFPTNDIQKVLRMRVGDTLTPAGLSNNVVAVENFYGAKGHIDVAQGSPNLRVVRVPNVETGTMDLEYRIDAGQKFFVEKIEIRGNTKTKDRVIRRELAVSPGETFDMVRVKRSKARLEGLQYFEKVDVQPEPTDIANRRNLVIGVEEKNTGNLSLGAGFSSVDSLVGYVEVSEGNFDLFKWNAPWFKGGGQKIRLRIQMGTERQDFLVAFVEPWFLGRKLALGVDLYHRDWSYQSVNDLYDEQRTGARLSLTRALWSDFLRGSVSYNIEQVGIFVDNSAKPEEVPQAVLDEEGNSLISSLGASLAYDTRNSTRLPNSGQKTELLASLAGGPMGGEKDFYKLELRSAWYFKGLFNGHVIEVVGRMGVADAFAQSETVPFYERYYLGGLYDLRGYEYHEISPREPGIDEPVGGDSYWFGTAEYSIPIIARVRVALFYDIGNVMVDAYDFSFSDYADNWGVGLRLDLPIGPLRPDYGIPMSHPDYAGGSGQFQFGVGYTREF